MLATIPSAALAGITGSPVSVEVHVSSGLPGFTIVGLPDTACREARDRVRAALLSSGLTWPQQRVTVNLAPSDLKKTGSALDLPMALGLLAASKQVPLAAAQRLGAVGELGLDGSVRPVAGVMCLVDAIVAEEVIVPEANGREAALVRPHEVRGLGHLRVLVDALNGSGTWPELADVTDTPEVRCAGSPLAAVRGQPLAKWAITVAAAGGHHLLLVGPPGAGKTMLAARLADLLPDLGRDEALTVARIRSAAGLAGADGTLSRRPPLRAPHHSASMVAMVGGGGSALRPGEISASHAGVLFLDELGEFAPSVLDALRQPLEEGEIRVSRAARSIRLPARFQMVAAMNPCPCGYAGPVSTCRCSATSRARYARRVSGPLLDRFDLRLGVRPADPSELLLTDELPDDDPRPRIAAARAALAAEGFASAREIPPEALDDVAPLAPSGRRYLQRALSSGRISARGLRSLRLVGRTLTDLDEAALPLDDQTVAQAAMLRVDPLLDAVEEAG